MEKTITMSKDEYDKIIYQNEKLTSNNTIIYRGTGFYITTTSILSNDSAVNELSKRVKHLEEELDRTLCFWQKRRDV